MERKINTSRVVGTLVILIAIVAIIVGCTAQSGNNNSDSNEEIKLGWLGPLSGDAAAYGEPLQQVVNLAVEEINNNGGIKGKKLKVIFEDGKCEGKEALSATQKLINIDGVKIILGGTCSGETLGAAPAAEQNKVILFSAGSGSPDITKSGDYVFRNFPSDATSGSKVAKAAIDNKHKKIAILAEQTEYAQAVKNVFKTTLTNTGGSVVIDESYASDGNDYRTQITKIKAANPDAIYVVAQTPAKYGLALKQIRELGVNQQIYTNEFAAAGDILKDYSKEVEGAIYAVPYFNENEQKSKELLDKLKAKYGKLSGALPPVYLATQYDAVYLLSESIEKCDLNTDCIKTELYKVKNREGATGTLTIDQNGDAVFEYVLKKIVNGKESEA